MNNFIFYKYQIYINTQEELEEMPVRGTDGLGVQ